MITVKTIMHLNVDESDGYISPFRGIIVNCAIRLPSVFKNMPEGLYSAIETGVF